MSLAKLIRRLIDDSRGATAVTFGLLAIPLAIIVLGGVDYSRMALAKQKLQEALDTASLMTARSGADTDAELDDAGDTYFEEHMDRSLGRLESTFKAGPNNTIDAWGSGYMKPIMLGLFGAGDVKIEVETVVKRAQGTPVELALVLDTTLSMEGQPIADLKKAATDMVNELHKYSDGDNLKIGVVPFGRYVNVGVGRRDVSWMYTPADTSTINPPKGSCKTVSTRRVCESEKYACTVDRDGRKVDTVCSRSINCRDEPITPKEVCPTATTSTTRFYGCAGSLDHPYNVKDDNKDRRYPGIMNVTCGAEITPLTKDKKTVLAAVSALKAQGNTYIPAGLDWGFNLLSPSEPFSEAAAYDKSGKNLEPRKALVLMTDGANTAQMQKRNGYPFTAYDHEKNASPAKQADKYMAELCENIKDQKIEVFTVAFNLDDKNAKKLVEDCATDSEHYFDAGDAAKLQSAFGRIAESLRKLMIAK